MRREAIRAQNVYCEEDSKLVRGRRLVMSTGDQERTDCEEGADWLRGHLVTWRVLVKEEDVLLRGCQVTRGALKVRGC